LGMPRQWEDQFFRGYNFESCTRRTGECVPACTGDGECINTDPEMVIPNFVNQKYVYPGLETARVTHPSQIEDAVKKALRHNGPYLLDVWVDRKENVYPIVPPGGMIKDMDIGRIRDLF